LKQALSHLLNDLFSAILFLAVYLVTANITAAAAVAITVGLANILIALYAPFAIRGWFISAGAIGAKLGAFALQYAVFRTIIRRARSRAEGAASRRADPVDEFRRRRRGRLPAGCCPRPDGGAVVAFFRKQMDDRSERAGTRP